jgi:Ca2+:H+ antiporter
LSDNIKKLVLYKSELIRYIYIILIPIIAFTLEYALHLDLIVTILLTSMMLIPLAKSIGDSTEHLVVHYSDTVASLLKVTFGNTAEIIIAIIAISEGGLADLVKASIIGSILANILFIFGLSLVAGGLKRKDQFFNKENTGLYATMLLIAISGLAIPTVLSNTLLRPNNTDNMTRIAILSDVVAFILLGVYLASIIFTFVTHRDVFKLKIENNYAQQQQKVGIPNHAKLWTKKKSFVILGLSMISIIIVGEILINSIKFETEHFGLGQFFVGAIIIGIVSNAPKHIGAITHARKDEMEMSIGIAAGSGTQIAIFVVPTLIIAGIIMRKPFTLVFSIFELVAVFFASLILNLIAHDGKSNWFEGVMLIAVYLIIAAGFLVIR